ncbi:MutS-related protein [Gracilibacillus alcaliphilus]|uniref:MutS-related protein n=1 Tax=Gracilibacillus alcaliphilus TaxID=1401441 RepID=UPI00195B8EEF|nr:hypothetical protein [Gracilibacillus alcaliphilus]MBM7676145.1 energy-coupling factor transporter ATP-binding protein EcfA2 [Gracilibacillus alcaliphilus]
MLYHSILFHNNSPTSIKQGHSTSDFFHDIHIHTIIQDIVKNNDEYDLFPLFYNKLSTIDAIKYRTAIMEEIDCLLLEPLETFSRDMRKVRKYADYSKSSNEKYQQYKWLLDAAYIYCFAVKELHSSLSAIHLQSLGLRRFYKWLTYYISTTDFTMLDKDTLALRKEFDQIQYSMFIEEDNILIYPDDNENDYCQSLSRAFKQEVELAGDSSLQLFAGVQLSEAEKELQTILRKHFPKPFGKLKPYYSKYAHFINDSIMNFDHELQFYIACLQYFRTLKHQGLRYCYPEISNQKELHIIAGYDLSLATSELHVDKKVIGNDFTLNPNERLCVLTGPNQGGKTTFARSLGQILYLSSIGCPVPSKQAKVFLFDKLFTHFPSKEETGTNAGKLIDELTRLENILDNATCDSVIILNELFSSTTTRDAYAMGKKTLRKLMRKNTMCLYVTHLFELAAVHDDIVSLVAATNTCDLSQRTFKITRRAADGLLHNSTMVEKYGLTLSQIKERIQT